MTSTGALRLYSSLSAPAGLLILELEGAVLSVQIDVPRASLLSLIGRLSLAHSAGGKSQREAVEPPQGSLCSLDIAALSSIARGSLPVPLLAPLANSSPVTSVRPVLEEHAEFLKELEQHDFSHANAPTANGNANRTSQKTRPDLLKRILKSLLEMPTGESATPPPPARLAVLLAQRLADAGQWDGLGQLLESQAAIPSASITGGLPAECSWLLPAAARAQQYRLLAPLCMRLEELMPAVVVETISTVLTPSTSSNAGPRKAHYAFVR